MRLVDGHCHLEPREYPDVPGVLSRMAAAGVVHAVVVGQFHAPGDFGHALDVARKHPDRLTATLGIHPHEAARATEADFAFLEETCRLPEVHAVGEAGLDFYYNRSPRDVQDAVFRRQCALTRVVNKPLVVHVRDAHAECAEVLRSEKPTPGVIHCFTGDLTAARTYLDLGFDLSISGVLTYKKTEGLAEAVRFAPLERLLVETDSPYLAPVPYRGKQNEPAYVVETGRKLAELKGVDVERAAEATTAAAERAYRFTA